MGISFVGGGSAGGVSSVGNVGSAPSAAGASVSGGVLTLQPADATHPGVLTTGSQTIAGQKQFTGRVDQSGGGYCFYCLSSGTFGSGGTVGLATSGVGAGASDVCVKIGTQIADASVHASAKILKISTGMFGTEVEKLAVTKSGQLRQAGTDSSATPGNATVNKPCGIAAWADGSNACVITNSLAAATSWIQVTPLDSLVEHHWVVRGAGSFTVRRDGTDGNVPFAWEVRELL